MAVQHGDTFATHLQHSARLRTFRDLERVLAFERWHLNFRAQCRLRKGDRNDAMQVGSLPLEEWVVLHVENDVKIARRAAMHSSFAQTTEANARLIFHARRNLGFDRLLLQVAAFASALGARIADHRAGSLAGGTRPRNTEKALLVTHLAASAAGAASRRGLRIRTSGTVASIAKLVTTVGNRLLGAENRFLEFDRDVLAKI